MKLVRRKRKRKPRLVIWVGHGYFTANSRGEKVIWVHDPYLVVEYFPSRRGENSAMIEGLEMRPRRRFGGRRLIPRPPHKRPFPPQFPLDLPIPPDKP